MAAKVLIVEDHPDSREILGIQIEHLGYEVIEALSGEEAIGKSLVENPDLIIMDIMLPGMNGIEAAIALKQNPKTSRIPVIGHSAWQENKDKVLAAGMVEFLPKPTLPRVFEEVLKRILGSAESEYRKADGD
jgi:two-component system phosphate regulon response regulator PhoB